MEVPHLTKSVRDAVHSHCRTRSKRRHFGPSISVQLISIFDFGSKFPLELSSRRSLSLTAGVPVDPHLPESARPLLLNYSTYQIAARQATDLYFPSWSRIASASWRGGVSGKACSQVISLASTFTIIISSSDPVLHIVYVPFPTLVAVPFPQLAFPDLRLNS